MASNRIRKFYASMVSSEPDSTGKQNGFSPWVTICSGTLDLSLFMSNLEHLRFVLEAGADNVPHYSLLVVLLSTLFILQFLVILCIILLCVKNYHDKNDRKLFLKMRLLYTTIVLLVTLMAAINVFITIFGDRSTSAIVRELRHAETMKGNF